MNSVADPTPARQAPNPATVLPLNRLSKDKQDEIARLVAEPTPPPRWLTFVGCQMPSRAFYEWYWQRGIEPDANRPSIPRSVRRAVIERDGLVCQLCLRPVEPSDVQVDHVLPFSRGGPDTVANLQVTHSLCNQRKGATYDA